MRATGGGPSNSGGHTVRYAPGHDHSGPGPPGAADAPDTPEAAPEPAGDDAPEQPRDGLTPRQARRLRIVVATVLLVALAAVLALRLASRTSVLVVGVYGLAMILCGVVIELSRHGRTRLGTWLLGTGLLTALCADWLLLP
ncbi:hypothetical protein [Streptomyces sudanensis]|uniref:hypothetical protein n=1 Tax=Streptomyces sudanensis TaxID=436397 RepID=UPI0020CBAFBD|nr:hypothetical protein [Streptomyces sudanensis]MCQ0000310.1 hypothetical protein [Streptomyces sudanensis]